MIYLEYLMKDKDNLECVVNAVASQYCIYNRKLIHYQFSQPFCESCGCQNKEDCHTNIVFRLGMEVDENGDLIVYTNGKGVERNG